MSIELVVQPPDERLRRRLWKLTRGCEAIDFGLHVDVSRGLDLENAPFAVRVEIPGERPLDVAGARVMAFD